MLLYIRDQLAHRKIEHALEIGTGNGTVMAALLAADAQRVTGVDLEKAAVHATQDLISHLGFGDRAHVMQSNMWQQLAHQRFDLIITNLPQFAAEAVHGDGHLPTWSSGGKDGRATVDLFLQGLGNHLASSGTALMTHNVFLDIEKTRTLLKNQGLQAKIVYTASAPLSEAKLQSMDAVTKERFTGHGLHSIGPYWFSDFQLLEISWSKDAKPAA